jgi:hypothetical protein
VNLKKYLLFILFTIGVVCANAQYIGGTSGVGTGQKLMLSATVCPLTYDTIIIFYRGGNYGSASAASIASTVCATRIDTTISFYRSGNYGSTSSVGISSTVCPTWFDTTISFYRSGNYGGYSVTPINSSVCSFSIDTTVNFYRSGNYGGYSNVTISSTACAYPEPINIWMGGASSTNTPGVINANTSNNTSGPYISNIYDPTIIMGGCGVTLTTTGSGATTYSWSPTTGLSSPTAASPVANPSTTTTYTLTASGGSAGCKNTATVTVYVNPIGATTISYPAQINNTITTLQNVTLTGYTNGVFTANSANLKINAANGDITPNTSTVGNYVVTYTYGGACDNTVTTNVEITTDAANHGEIKYPNFYLGATAGTATPKQIITQGSCIASIDTTQLIFRGGVTGAATPKQILTQGVCIAYIDLTTILYKGGTTGAATPKTILTQGACAPLIILSNTIYMGGTAGTQTPKTILTNAVCPAPVGSNFYMGGSGTGYGNGSLTPSTSALNGTAVATRIDTTICPGQPIVLTTTGAANYSWTPATALSSTLIASPTASPLTTTTYTVVGAGGGVGCLNTAKITVTVLSDSVTRVSYGAYSFDETDMRLKTVNYIYGPLTGTFSATPSGLSLNQTNGSFTPGFSTAGVYAINYNYTKGACNYTYVSNINITTLPPAITYTNPSIFLQNSSSVVATPFNSGGIAVLFEALDAFPTGLSINSSTGEISGTPTTLVENASVRIRAANYNRYGALNYSDIFTLLICVRKPLIASTTTSVASMNTTYGAPSPSNAFNISGQSIYEKIIVAPPVGFEVSTNANTGFATTLNVTQSGGIVSSRNIYIRIKSNGAVGNLTGNIALSSVGADTVFIPVTTSYVAPASLTVTAKTIQKFYGSTVTIGVGSSNFTTTGLMNGETIGSVTLSASGGNAATDPVGTYTLTPSAAIGGTFSTGNYNISYANGQLEVLYSLYNFSMSGSASNWVQGKVPIPKIAAGTISNITSTDATIISIISSSYTNISERGVCWSITPDPTIAGDKLADAAISSGSFTSNLTGLTAATIYYVRTYVKIGNKVFYSNNYKLTTQ